MKKRSILLGYLMTFTFILGVSISLGSCSKDKDEPNPEIVTDHEVYYIVGEVQQDGKSLEGVKVTTGDKESTTAADGQYKLELPNKGDYTVTFAKDGYVTVNSHITINASVKNKASVAHKQELVKKNDPVTVTPDQAHVLTCAEQTGVTLSIPAGAVKQSVDISMTDFIPGLKQPRTAGSAHASLISLNLEPDGHEFETPVKLSLKNPMEEQVSFANMIHMIEKNGVMEEVGPVGYDDATHHYVTELTGFSNHAFAVATNASTGSTSTETLASQEIDNLGNMSSKDDFITMTQKYGWTIDGNLADMLRSSYPVLTETSITGLVNNITTAVSSLMGSSPGVGELSLAMPFRVSGDTKVTINFLAHLQNSTYSFPLIFVDGNLAWFDVPVKRYIGTEVQTTYQYGNTHTDHSGGSGQ